MVSSPVLGYIPVLRSAPNIYKWEGIAMLLGPRLPLFACRFALTAAMAVAGVASSALAQTPPPGGSPPPGVPAAASGTLPTTAPDYTDPYAIAGIKVDVSADNANVARDRAIAAAHVRAWQELYQRVVPNGGPAPKLSDSDLSRLVQGFSIDDEKVTPTRYLASITVKFRPDAVRNQLAGTSSLYAEPPARPYVLLPVTMVDGKPVLWEDHTPWRNAWESRTTNSLVPLTVPPGELPDVAAIDATAAVAGNPESFVKIQQKYNAPSVVVVRASLPAAGQPLPATLTTSVSRIDANGERQDLTVTTRKDADDRLEDLVRRAVIQTSEAIDEAYRKQNTIAAGPEQTISMVLEITGLSDWIEAKKRLTGINVIARADMLSLGRTAIKLSVAYRGDLASLKQQLARHDLMLDDMPGQPGAPSEYKMRLMPRSVAPAPLAPVPAPAVAPTSITPPTGRL